MSSLPTVVLDELGDHVPKMSLAERHDPIQTLAPDGQDESFSEGVQIGTSWREPDDPHAGTLQSVSELCRVERISVEYEVAFPKEESVVNVEQVTGDLFRNRCTDRT